jgi:hypothetical protein
MPRVNCIAVRLCLRLALVVAILGLMMLTPLTARADSYTVSVPPPNGTDDTKNLQSALDTCVAYGSGCTVQLAAGNYLTKQLVAYNFRGTFKGKGKDRTVIEALPNLPVNLPDFSVQAPCMPNPTTCLWPSLIMFVEGDIHISDISIKVTAPPGTATTGWFNGGSKITDLIDTLRFMGQHRTNAYIDRIAIEGLPDDSPTSLLGFNVVNGVIYTGELPRSTTPFDYYFLSGTLTVRNSFFKTTDVGVSQDGFVKNTRVTIGGSPSAGNVFENLLVGIDMEASESSIFDISYNTSSGIWYSMWVVPWRPEFIPSKPSQYFIHDNKFTPTGTYAGGVYLWNDPGNPWIHAMIYNNTVEPQDTLWDGIGAYNTKGTAIWNNTITGSGADAIGLWGSTLGTIISNNVGDFTLDPTYGLAQIYLDPATTYDLVVCSNSNNTVLDQGTMNKVVGCRQSTASAEAATRTAPTASTARPNLPRRKPPLP